jgi:hypothetical protein
MALVNKQAALMVKDDEARLNLIGLAYDLLDNENLQKHNRGQKQNQKPQNCFSK